MNVVLDANVLVSFLLTRSPTISKVIQSWKNSEFKLLVSDEIMLEYKKILARLVRKSIILSVHANALLEEISKEGFNVEVISEVEASPDKKDNKYLSCARDVKADYLVTGDRKHLLKLKQFNGTKIISPKEFVEILGKK